MSVARLRATPNPDRPRHRVVPHGPTDPANAGPTAAATTGTRTAATPCGATARPLAHPSTRRHRDRRRLTGRLRRRVRGALADDQLGGEQRWRARVLVPVRACSIAAVSAAAARWPLAAMSWRTVVRLGRTAAGDRAVVEADHRQVARDGHADGPRRLASTPRASTSEKHSTAVGGSSRASSEPGRLVGLVVVVVLDLHDRRGDPGRSESVEPAEHPLTLRVAASRQWVVDEPAGPSTARLTMPIRRWPRSTRCWAAARAPPRSSTLTLGMPGHRVLIDEHERQLGGGAATPGRRFDLDTSRPAHRPWRRRGRGRRRRARPTVSKVSASPVGASSSTTAPRNAGGHLVGEGEPQASR